MMTAEQLSGVAFPPNPTNWWAFLSMVSWFAHYEIAWRDDELRSCKLFYSAAIIGQLANDLPVPGCDLFNTCFTSFHSPA